MNIGIKDVLYKIQLFFIPYLILLVICLLIKLNFSKEQIYFAVNSRNCSFADAIAPYITDLGNGWTTIAFSGLLLLFNYRRAFILAVSYAITSLSAQVVKHIFDAPRPILYFSNRLNRIHFVKGVYMLGPHSFPSGHTVTAFSTLVIVTYWCKNREWGLPLFVVACLVGYSRMYLSEHFFEDVVAGSALGLFITVFILSWLDKRKFLRSPKWNRGLFGRFTPAQ